MVGRSDWIVAQAQIPVVRNLLITEAYHELGEELDRRLDSTEAMWCHFGCWASKTAGTFIRKEFVPSFLEALPRSILFLRSLESLVDQIAGEVSGHITEGNLKVFAELGPFFSELIECLPGPAQLDETRLQALIDRLAPGRSIDGGQDLLREACGHLRELTQTSDADRKAELTLWISCLVGLHEQIRLQPHIAGALDAPVEVTLLDLWNAQNGWIQRLLPRALTQAFASFIDRRIQRAWEYFATWELMVLQIGAETLHLGRDLPRSPFPAGLTEIADPQLRELLRRFDPNLKTTVGSGAENWTILNDRMGYIVELFRVRQSSPVLHEPPFTEAQRKAMLELRLPSGKL